MTNFLKTFAPATVAFMMLSTAASALTLPGPVIEPGKTNDSSVFKTIPYWQKFDAEKGDLHWNVVADYLDQAQKRDEIKGQVYNGVPLSAESVVMGTIVKVNGGRAKFGVDAKGLPTLIVGERYLLPVPTSEGFVVKPKPLTQAELLAQMQEQITRYEAQQQLSAETFAGFSAQLAQNGELLIATIDRVDGLATSQEELKESVGQIDTRLSAVASEVNGVRTAVQGVKTVANEAKQLAAQATSDVAAAVNSANQAMTTATQTAEDLKEFEATVPATAKAAVRTALVPLTKEGGVIDTRIDTATTQLTKEGGGIDQRVDARIPGIITAAETAAKAAVKPAVTAANTTADEAKKLAQEARDAAANMFWVWLAIAGVFAVAAVALYRTFWSALKTKVDDVN